MDAHLWLIVLMIFWVAMLYASVGHGGASGYQAVLSVFSISFVKIASTALCLNILVAGLAAYNYRRAGHFSWRLTWPFIIASIPAAFIGGMVRIPEYYYSLLLGLVLVFAAWRLGQTPRPLVPAYAGGSSTLEPPVSEMGKTSALLSGGIIGVLSGMLGIGGGIFLSPLMLLMRWSSVKQAAATSAVFIVVNAFSGLMGRIVGHNLVLGNMWMLIPAAMAGGCIGAYWGACRFNNLHLRRLLSLVLLLAAGKLLWSSF